MRLSHPARRVVEPDVDMLAVRADAQPRMIAPSCSVRHDPRRRPRASMIGRAREHDPRLPIHPAREHVACAVGRELRVVLPSRDVRLQVRDRTERRPSIARGPKRHVGQIAFAAGQGSFAAVARGEHVDVGRRRIGSRGRLPVVARTEELRAVPTRRRVPLDRAGRSCNPRTRNPIRISAFAFVCAFASVGGLDRRGRRSR